MKAVVMAGGSGSRLRPLTVGRPKPMVPVVNQPVMGHILNLLKQHHLTDVVVTVQYLADMIEDYFGDGHHYDMNIHYSLEETPLGTAGSVKNAQEFLDETFVVISGDAITDIDLTKVIEFHKSKQAKVTLTLYRVPNPLEYGVIIVDENGRIQRFLEKPSWGEVISDTVNTGIYVIEPDILDRIEPGAPFDFSNDLFPLLMKEGIPLYGYVADGYWCDVGDIKEYMRATADLLNGKVKLGELGHPIGGNIWVGDDVEIAPDAELYGPIYLGNGVKIKGKVVMHGPSVVRDSTIIDTRANVDRSIIWRNSYVGEGVELRGAIVGRQCSLKSNAVVFEGVVIGDNTIVGESAIIHPEVKIWPGKEIEAGAIVKSSIIWGSQGRRVLFGRFGVTGLVNVDLTPEMAARLGAAFGATLARGATVTINRDPHRSPRMIKRAVISGLPSAGVNVLDLRSLPIPVARFMTRQLKARGGIHIRLSPFDQRTVDVRFFDSQGRNLSKAAERNIERVFFREDFRRVYLEEIGTINYAEGAEETYIQHFMKAIDVETVRKAKLYIVVDYAYAPSAQVLPDVLTELNCNVVALNARIDETKMSISQAEFDAALAQLATICAALHTDLGVRLDVGGEKIFLVDDRGAVLPGTLAAAAMTALALRDKKGGKVAVPVNQPSIFEKIAAQYEGQIVRTKVDAYDFTAQASKEDVVLGCDGTGNFIFPDFQEAVDGLIATAKLLEFLARQQTRLSEVVASLSPYYVAQQRVSCPWEAKGTIMRLLHEQYQDYGAEMIDGIKIPLGDEWVLIRPDPDQPLFHVYAESRSDPEARALADKYVRVVESLRP
jgi:mannose-1-phosphate guanylyltransferase/phosphomannomutase